MPSGQWKKEPMRKLIRLAVATLVTGLLVGLSTATQAGIALNGID